MNRRHFLSTAGAAALTGATAGCHRGSDQPSGRPADPRVVDAPGLVQPAAVAERRRPRPVKMVIGCQRGPTTPELLQFFKRHCVDHICGYPVIEDRSRGHWTVAELARTRELCEKHGVALDLVALPFLKSSHIDREARPAIMLGKGPERQKDVDDIHRCIEACAKVGVPAFKYNMSILGVVRTEATPGRGGTRLSSWRLKQARPRTPLTRAGRVSAELAWERITWFLQRVIPVCNQHKVRAACHPHDPGMPPEGYQGVVRVLGTPEGLKKFVAIHSSPYHGLNFCVGSVAEMLEAPGSEIVPLIRWFGARKKIFNIHFRNIRGKRDDFVEVFPDEGSMNMVEVARALRDVDYDGMVMPDHMPRHDDDPGGMQAFAFGYGYIKAILQSLQTLG
jgi:mannonate dehydratase